MTANPNQATLTADGLAIAPVGAPAVVQEIIAAGNEIARLPYRYGGGHATYEDTGVRLLGIDQLRVRRRPSARRARSSRAT